MSALVFHGVPSFALVRVTASTPSTVSSVPIAAITPHVARMARRRRSPTNAPKKRKLAGTAAHVDGQSSARSGTTALPTSTIMPSETSTATCNAPGRVRCSTTRTAAASTSTASGTWIAGPRPIAATDVAFCASPRTSAAADVLTSTASDTTRGTDATFANRAATPGPDDAHHPTAAEAASHAMSARCPMPPSSNGSEGSPGPP